MSRLAGRRLRIGGHRPRLGGHRRRVGRISVLAVALALAASACGRYGPPIRGVERPAAKPAPAAPPTTAPAEVPTNPPVLPTPESDQQPSTDSQSR